MTEGINLRPVFRTATGNLFVRLSQQTAARLRDAAEADDSNGWSGSSRIEFLPLQITAIHSGETVYASYNGGDLDWIEHYLNQDEAENYIDLPPGLLSTSSNTFVNVKPLESVSIATDLLVEPVTTADWELVELDAAWLENGGLLQQVSVVYVNQIIPLVLSNKKDVARIRVLPPTCQQASLWPDESPCLRLVADTRVIVAPKPRKHEFDPKLRLYPTREDCGDAEIQLASHLGVGLVSIDQCTVAIHPNTLSNYDAGRLIGVVRADQEFAIVRIVPCPDVPEEHIALHPLVRLKIKANLSGDRVALKVLTSFEINEKMLSLDIVESRQARLYLQRVKVVQHPTSNVSWRIPDTSPFSQKALFRFGGDLDGRESCVDDVVDLPPTIANIPLQIGGLVSLPWDSKGTQCNLYRLMLESESEGQDIPRNRFIFARALSNFLRSSRELLISPFDELFSTRKPHSIECPIDGLMLASSVFTAPLLHLMGLAISSSSTLVYGERGCGKTHTALAVSAAARLTKGFNTVYLDCRKLKSSRVTRMKTILAELSKLFDDANSLAPCVVVLDDLDELTPTFGGSSVSDDSLQVQQVNPVEMDQSKLITDVVRHILRKQASIGSDLSIVVTCRLADSLPVSLFSDGGFDNAFEVPTFSAEGRESLYSSMLKRHMPTSVAWATEGKLNGDFGRKTAGFRPRDIEQLALRVIKNFTSQTDPLVTYEQTTVEELANFIPLTRLGAAAETAASVGWSDVGGLFSAKAELTSTILRPSMYRRIYERARIRLPRGILLYGYPGTGKSFCIPALANECGFPLIMCRGPELLDKYIGASEAKVRELFSRAASAAPSILFLDELDSLAPRRGTDHTGVTDRVVNQLLTFLDGVEDTARTGQVYVVAATSRPDKIDPALLRPGRLEKHIYVGYAEQAEEWTDLLSKIAYRFQLDHEATESISSGQFVENVLKESSSLLGQLSAADVKAIFSTAQLTAVHEALTEGNANDTVSIRYHHLMTAFLTAKPSLTKTDFHRLREIYSAYRSGLTSQVGADIASGSSSSRQDRPLLTALR